MKRLLYLVTLVAAMTSLGCPSHPVAESDEKVCPGGGEDVEMPTGRDVCVYRWPIVIETGFDCPAHRSDRFDVPRHFATCSGFGPPTDLEIDYLYRRFGNPLPNGGWAVLEGNNAPGPAPRVDILWVIDNSGSMCEEQKMLRDNFSEFVSEITRQPVDFQIGITTTHMRESSPLEPVASPGMLQSTPQPVPGFDRSCHNARDATGMVIEGDYTPVRDNIALAVDCMLNPDPSYLNVTDAEIECALYGRPDGCSIPRAGCGGADECTAADLFPPPSSYRPIPQVLRSVDYTVDGVLDVESLDRDFACASMVGTRGDGFEKGLQAAAAAVAPTQIEAGNRGFLRRDAAFAVMFVSDEDDCSHDGTLAEDGACGADVCAFENDPSLEESSLLTVNSLRAELIGNLTGSKQRPIDPGEVFASSIHGFSERFSGPRPTPEQCRSPDYEGLTPTCATALGTAHSGDRYMRYLQQFPEGNAFPDATGDAPTAWICQGDFSPALAAFGSWLGTGISQ